MKLIHKTIITLNILAIIIMLMSGYSGYINPAGHSYWALMGYGFPFILAVNVCFLVVWAWVKWRYLFIPIAGLALAYPSIKTYIPVNPEYEAPEGSLKVVSYNILAFNKPEAPEGEPNPILRYIVESKADIVCLQEYSACCESDSLWPECERLYPHRDTMMTGKTGDCLALYSKYPIIKKERINIESEKNSAAAFTLNIKGKSVCVINVHLETVGLSHEEKENFSDIVHGKSNRDSVKQDSKNLISKITNSTTIRAPQADVVHDYVRRKLAECRSRYDANHIDGGVILCGDFNDHPLSYVHRTIADELTDCYAETGRGPGFSMHIYSLHFRIDNIMCSSNWQPYQCTVDKSISLSDHYPIYCYFKYKKEQ